MSTKTYKCKYCDKEFSTQYTLINHQNTAKYCLELQKKKPDEVFISEIFEKTQPELKRLFEAAKYQLDSLNDTGDLSDQDYITCLAKLDLLRTHTRQKGSNSTTKNASTALLKSCAMISKNSLLHNTSEDNTELIE